MSEIQQSRYDRLLRRVADLKGPGSKVNDVLQELFPVIDVEQVPGELLFLSGTKLGWGGAQKTGDAVKKAGVQLFNPVGSGQLVTVEELVLIVSGSARRLHIGITTITLPTNTGLALLRDTRSGSNVNTAAQVRTSGDAIATTNMSVRLAGNTTISLSPRNGFCVLGPGTGLTVVDDSDQQTINVSFFWRERIAEPSEVNF